MADIGFDRNFEPHYGAGIRLSPLIERVVCNNPGPFTFYGTGTYLIGKDRLCIIDPGPDDDQHFDALIAAIAGRDVSHILITHTHLDHSPLAARLKQATGAETCGVGPHSNGLLDDGVRIDAGGDLDFVPDVEIRHGDVITGNGWNMECVFTPGHTANHMCFALLEENSLFTGDHIMAWSTSVIIPPDGNMGDYYNSLKLLIERDDAVYWPTHGGPRHKPKPYVRAFLTHRLMREEAILRRIQKGDRQIMTIVENVYSDIDPRLHPAAAMSTLAHIQHLLERGKIKADKGVSLKGEFWV